MKKKITVLLLLFGIGFNALAQQYDLWIPAAIDWNPATSGGFLKISQTAACNYGPGTANESFDVGLIVKDQNTGELYIIAKQTITDPDIAPGNCMFIYNLQGYIADAVPPVPSGTYVWGVWIDSGEEITEPDETNNFRIINNVVEWSSSLGIEPVQSTASMNVFPNPVNSSLAVQSEETMQISIMTISGKVLSTQQLNTGINYIDVSNFSNGIYFLLTETGKQVKFVKE